MTMTTLAIAAVSMVMAAFVLGVWLGREWEADAWAYRAVCNTAMYRDGEFYSVTLESDAIKHRLAYARERAERAEFDMAMASLLTDVIVDKYSEPPARHFRVEFPKPENPLRSDAAAIADDWKDKGRTRDSLVDEFGGMLGVTDAENLSREVLNAPALTSDTVKLTPLSDADYKALGFDLSPHAVTRDSNCLKVADEQP